METAYKLRNETSDSITLWLAKGSSEGPQGNTLATGQELAFSLATRGTITSGEHATITVGIPGCKPQVIDMDRIGSQIYRFATEFPFGSTTTHKKQGQKAGHRRGRSSSISRNFVTIACNLFLDGPVKVASLRAVLFVENDTNDPIQLTLKKPAAGVDEDMPAGGFIAIRPGGGCSIEAHTERIWIRPDARFLWATVDVPPVSKDGVRTEQVQAVSRAINLAAGITCFATCAESTNGAVSLHIMPTLAIHNRLPCMMNARVYRYQNAGKTECMIPAQKMDKLTADKQAQAWEGSLWPGEASHHCFGSSADHLLLSLQIDGFSWSQPVVIESPVHFVSKTLELRDEKRRTLTLGLDNRMGTEERCWRSVAVFCSCWIVNLTGLPLLYSGSSSGLVELAREGHTTAAGEPPDGNTSSQPVLIGWQRASFKVADTTAAGGTIATIGETAETAWSKPFSTTAIRTSGVTSVVEKETAKDVRTPPFISFKSVVTTHRVSPRVCLLKISSILGSIRASSGQTSSITCLVLKLLTSCVVVRKQVGGIRKKGLETDKAASGRRDMEASIAAALQMGRRRRYDICVTVALGKGKFRRTKVVRLEPQFMLHNRIVSSLVYKQHNTDFEVSLAPKSSSPVWWSDYSEDRHVCFRSAGGHSTIHCLRQ